MEIIGSIAETEEYESFTLVRCTPDGTQDGVVEPIQKEHILEIDVDGRIAMRTRCTTTHVVELVVGRLVTSGVVASPDRIASLGLSEDPLRADVRLLAGEGNAADDWAIGDEGLLHEGFIAGEKGLAKLNPIPWTPEEVFREAEEFARDRTTHRVTYGTHSAYLFRRGELLACREDIGRHNAFDKIVGAALLGGIDLRECSLFTSGRVPTDMCVKAVRAGIPLVVTKAVATLDAVKMARSYDLTLLCKAYPESFEVMNDPMGVCDPPRAR